MVGVITRMSLGSKAGSCSKSSRRRSYSTSTSRMGLWQEWTSSERSSAGTAVFGGDSTARSLRFKMSACRQARRVSSPGSWKREVSSYSKDVRSSRKSFPRVPMEARRGFPRSRKSSSGERSGLVELEASLLISRSEAISPQYSRQGFKKKRLTSVWCASPSKICRWKGGR